MIFGVLADVRTEDLPSNKIMVFVLSQRMNLLRVKWKESGSRKVSEMGKS
jgi:hypothetical protein